MKLIILSLLTLATLADDRIRIVRTWPVSYCGSTIKGKVYINPRCLKDLARGYRPTLHEHADGYDVFLVKR